jgi:EAL domain-containing protein (putative c-di-GMP-specific phosphodiesterase class I)
LRSLGCHLGQGFLMSRPVAPEAIDMLLAVAVPFPHVQFDATINRLTTARRDA